MTAPNILTSGKECLGLKAISLTSSHLLVSIGANRGIGFNILKAFVSRSWNVTGTIRPQSRSDSSVHEVRLFTSFHDAEAPQKRQPFSDVGFADISLFSTSS